MLNKLQRQIAPQWLQFQDQIQSNIRLRWMLWLIAYIVIFYVALSLSDWRQSNNETIAQLQRTSFKLEQLQSQTQWPERLKQEQQTKQKLRARLWETQSESLAEADLQNYLRKLASDHRLENYRPRLAPSERVQIAGETLIKVSAEVSGSVGASQIDHLLKVIADSPKLLVVDRFSYAPQRSGQLEFQVTAYFLITEGDAGAGAEPQGAGYVR